MRKHLGLWSGVGLVIANMVGAGVFLSAGFMAQDLGPGLILLAWVVGAVLALCGSVAYAEVARLVPRSGGEYRYLSTLLHPALGYLAGWASLLVGFSAPIAVDALAAGDFFVQLTSVRYGFWTMGVSPEAVAAVLVVTLALLHSFGLSTSARGQNALIIIKVALLLGFASIGLIVGSHSWPTWVPPHASEGFPTTAFVGSLFFIAFAFSGWNAAIYASEEFDQPTKTVPRAMIIGCSGVAVLYLLINFVFVANLEPKGAAIVMRYTSDRVTLGHAVMEQLLGPNAAKAMSCIILLAFISAISAMTLVGPRVYAAMAKDGFLPKVLAGKEGDPPRFSVLMQTALALLLVFTHDLKNVLESVGAVLTLFAAMTMVGLFRRARATSGDKPRPIALLAALIYTGSTVFMLVTAVRGWLRPDFSGQTHPEFLVWIAIVTVVALVGWALTPNLRAKLAPPPPPAQPGSESP